MGCGHLVIARGRWESRYAMLSARDVCITVARKPLFSHAAVTVRPGQIKILAAPNGFGKTTLLRILAGEYVGQRSGLVNVDGIVPTTKAGAPYRRKVFFAGSNAVLLEPSMTVRAHMRSVRSLWASALSIDDAARICGVQPFIDRPVRVLSKGMRQQVVCALAYLSAAPYVLLDEPCSGLDVTNTLRLSGVLHELAASGRAAIVSSHVFEGLQDVCQSVLWIDSGAVEDMPVEVTSPDVYALFWERYGLGGDCA